MNAVYIKHSKTVGLIWGGCFGLFVLVYMIALAPQSAQKAQVENQLAEKKQVYDSAMELSQQESKARLKEEIERLQSKMRDFVVGSEDSANLTFDISQAANEKKVSSFNIKASDTRKTASKSETSYIAEEAMDIQFEGGFNQFATLLNDLERHRPVVFVDKFSITRSENNNSEHKASMSLSVFTRKRQTG
jgi:Tfp pilus assembly protein PilO